MDASASSRRQFLKHLGAAAVVGTMPLPDLLAGLVLLPIGFVWSLAERSRGATAVLAVVGITEAFVVVRALQVWSS